MADLATKPVQKSPVRDQLDRLERNISELQSQLNTLGLRLAPISIYSDDVPSAFSDNDSPVMSEIEGLVSDSATRVGRLTGIVSEMIDNLRI